MGMLRNNDNEYEKDGRIYIKNIHRCEVAEVNGNSYMLSCKILDHGKHIYFFRKGNEYIVKNGISSFWLEKSALDIVLKAVEDFDNDATDIKANYTYVEIKEIDSCIWYRRIGRNKYRYLLEQNEKAYPYGKIFESTSLEEMLSPSILFKEEGTFPDIHIKYITRPNMETIESFPFYQAAVNTNDKLMQKHIKFYYNIADNKELSWLGKMLGRRILPSLPKEFDKDYIVDTDTVNYSILHDSGYTGWHVPYFDMKGRTHDKMRINPYFKSYRDAAKIEEPSISFNEFLEIFEPFCFEEDKAKKQEDK